MNSKHTPGPWRIDSGRHGIHIRAGKPTDPLGGDLVSATFNYANARLIAAAPDLLAALRELVQYVHDEFSCSHPLQEAADRARSAIAVATED